MDSHAIIKIRQLYSHSSKIHLAAGQLEPLDAKAKLIHAYDFKAQLSFDALPRGREDGNMAVGEGGGLHDWVEKQRK